MLSLPARQQRLIKEENYDTEFTFVAHPRNPNHHARVFINKTPSQKPQVSLKTFPNITYNQLRLDEENLEAYLNHRQVSADEVAEHLRETFKEQLNQSYAWNQATKHLLEQEHELADETALANTLGERLFAYNALQQARVNNPPSTLKPIYDALGSDELAEGKDITKQNIEELLENTQIPEEIEHYTPREYLHELALKD